MSESISRVDVRPYARPMAYGAHADESLDLVALGYVGRHRESVELLRELLQPVGAPRRKRDAEPVLGQRTRDGEADPARGPGDQRCLQGCTSTCGTGVTKRVP